MKRVWQTRTGKDNGNCMQAAMASMFEVDLDAVPDFKEEEEKWFSHYWDFVKRQGHRIVGTLSNQKYSLLRSPEYFKKNKVHPDRFPELKTRWKAGVHGYFFAGVLSPTYYDPEDKDPISHAVIIDADFNIVHPVSRDYEGMTEFPLSDKIGYNGIIDVVPIVPFDKGSER